MNSYRAAALAVCAAFAFPASAQETMLEAKASFIFDGQRINIGRNQKAAAKFVDRFHVRAQDCETACLASMQAAPGIETVGEADVLRFLEEQVGKNVGLLVDARMPVDRAAGFIPGSVSLPHAAIAPGNTHLPDILKALGARAYDDLYNFADARQLLVFDTGPSENDAAILIEYLMAAGYPAEKIKYYRGGMQVWSMLGLSIAEGSS